MLSAKLNNGGSLTVGTLHCTPCYLDKMSSIKIIMWSLVVVFTMAFSINISAEEHTEDISVSQQSESGFSGVEDTVSLNTNTMLAKLQIPSSVSTPTPVVPKFVPFDVGEKFSYAVNWGNINAGSATLGIEDIIEYQGHEVYQVVVEAKSNKFFSVFYQVHDTLESLIDVNGLFTRRYWTKQDEGNRKSERKYEFHQEQNVARHKGKEYYIQYGIQDEVSSILYVRTLDLRVGTPVYVDIFAKKKNWRVKCNVLRIEKIRVPAGEFETILVEPELRFDGVMKKGKAKIWFTNDQWHIPVQVQSKVKIIGAITMKLKSYRLGEVAHNK